MQTLSHKLIIFCFMTLLLISLVQSTLVKSGNILRVPQEYPTIQSALNNAKMGDTIIISNGIYHEDVIFLTSRLNNVILMGSDNTILEGTIEITGETSNVTIKNIIIRTGAIHISGNGTIIDGVKIFDSGVGIKIGASNIKIINTHFNNVGHSIETYELPSWFEKPRENLMIDNVVINNASLSIHIEDYKDIIISRLKINNCDSGLLIASRFNETNIELKELNITCNIEGIHAKIFGNIKISNIYLRGGINGIIIESEDPERRSNEVIINETTVENFKVNGISITSEIATLTNLKIFNNTYGLNLETPKFTITKSSFIKNGAKTYALSIGQATYGLIYLNEFIDNGYDITYRGSLEKNIKLNSETKLSYTYGGKNLISYLGNYWSKNTECRDIDNNGICDIPYTTYIAYKLTLTDYYPLARPLNYYKIITITPTSTITTTSMTTTITPTTMTTIPTTPTSTTTTTTTYDYTTLVIGAIILIIIAIIAFLILRKH
ncbi:MAG: hypothetical protein ACP5OK_08285 [Thermoprotei archaeon]